MYFRRMIERVIGDLGKTFPATVITGPRQSGKSNLLKHVVISPETSCISLEDPNRCTMILKNPLAFEDTPLPAGIRNIFWKNL
jgi:uncharacterized protein